MEGARLRPVLQAVHKADGEQFDAALPGARDAPHPVGGAVPPGEGDERVDGCEGVLKVGARDEHG